jgi:hypothetical protein
VVSQHRQSHALVRLHLAKAEDPSAHGHRLELLKIAVRNPELSGKSLGELMTALPGGVQIVALRGGAATSRIRPTSSSPKMTYCSRPLAPGKRSRRRARSWAKPPTATSSRTAGTSTICVCLLSARRW